MLAPSSFQPATILAPDTKLPPPIRSRYRKFDIYPDVKTFKLIDEHAIEVSQQDHPTFRDLIYHLVYSPNFQAELDKARVIFRWMTCRNMHTLKFKDVPNPAKSSPEEVLLSFKNKKGTYARIFETMCGYAGLYCAVLTGYAKGLDYHPGDKFKGAEYNHSWNACFIDGNWYLVDSHWATRYLISERNSQENLVYEYDDFYFMTDPEQLIYSHWAQRERWQLLSQSLTLAQFEDLPLVKSYFFKCGMFFMSHQKGVVKTQNGKIAITCGFVKPTNFTYKIVMAENGDEMYNNHKLKNYALQETQNNQATFVLRAPKAGSFYLTIFAQLLTGDIGVKNVFTASAEYKVVADTTAHDASPLPNCSDSNWGPGVPVSQLGLVPSQKDAVISTTDGNVAFSFRKTRPTYILCKLRHPGMGDEALERCISETEIGDEIHVTATLPRQGEYGLEIYGNDPSKDGDTYTHICQYFVHYAQPEEQATAFYQEAPQRRVVPNAHQATLSYVNPNQLAQNVSDMNMGGGQNEIDLDSLPAPPPEFLQQQYLYGTVPDSRQQGHYPGMSQPHGQNQPGGQAAFTPGAGNVILPPTQQKTVINIPPSQPIMVEKRSVGQEPPSAPQEFKLIPVKMETEEGPPPAPAAPAQQKPSLENIDRQVLHTVDDHAIQVSKSEHPTFRDLVWDLIYSKNITNEIEKVRVIFRWLATKNLKEIDFNNVEKGSPEEVLMGLKTGKTTYAMVFDTMCCYAGLHSKIISGYAKGADYRPGQKFMPGSNQHSWTAVYIYGTWCLLDAHWAARRIIGKQAQVEEFHYQLDEYFFLPDPHQLIYTHFPDDPKWQLLDRPVSLEEFENMPHMKPQFFKYGLEFVSHRTAVIYGRGEINVRLRYPAHKLVAAFNFTIQYENSEEEFQGMKLNRYGMHESVGGIGSFRLRLPEKGSYILYIYAKEDTPENTDNVYAQVCEYKIVQEEVSCPPPQPFPPCATLHWGPGSAFFKYGLATYQQTANIITREGKVELQIRIPKQMQFMAKLKHISYDDADLDCYVMHRIVGNTAHVTCSVPSRGEYGLEIYGNDPSTEGKTLFHIAQYLVECHEDVKTTPLPKLPPGYLGAQSKFSEYGLNTLSHHDPVIHLETNYIEIQFDFATEMRVTANLISVDQEKDFPEFVFTQTQGSVISFMVTIPTTGFYKLQLYAIPAQDPSQQLPGVYNYLLNCQNAPKAPHPFPKQYAQWKEGCFMWTPTRLYREMLQGPERIANFRVLIPRAEAAAMVVDSDWTHLSSNQPGIWEGDVSFKNHHNKSVKVTLNANYGGDRTNYATLLEYNIDV
ncbi:uncharacterized protein LOC117340002 [Pecten maximus]|uniref:uncharacterized protein LOC117340002 n=1 Tax=Pecten maximus TaxID=6579 RepID=UPI001458BBE1|nr:uncharacterized protein LOC117340002 [Pecten maximus]XP_033757636.1 uncharacterized protein LOC117340002 [Pecten maximus]XP_033757637.1 uncharacterized protein LOC117340002 [Pecten maximus]